MTKKQPAHFLVLELLKQKCESISCINIDLCMRDLCYSDQQQLYLERSIAQRIANELTEIVCNMSVPEQDQIAVSKIIEDLIPKLDKNSEITKKLREHILELQTPQ